MERLGTLAAGGAEVRTGCGRTIVLGRLVVGDRDPVGRVVLRINCLRGERDQLWAGLTSAEARLLAGYLLRQADLVDDRTGNRSC